MVNQKVNHLVKLVQGTLHEKGTLHELNQLVNLMVNHLVKRRRVARDANPQVNLT